MHFERITEENIHMAHQLYNANPAYNLLENGQATRTLEKVRGEFLDEKATESYIAYEAEDPVGLVDFLPRNPKDGYPWIGLMMVDQNHHGKGIGSAMYQSFESLLKERGFTSVRLAVLVNNERGHAFWERMGFTYYGMSQVEENEVTCLEKEL
ncbi:GNAT family N-acetyltransferase [Halobacillus litoralis]|uniref:GNAT family N-acetyltransferase n=1 Tax=Halobacillus litoralis TaxID=45668 RepID=UPI001CD1BDA9|nr:GNAT family N-acetyltransferase [Halobacillus litoralis]MCA0972069.1 GNAT family N-acetyltransferase [Halobacillus litoralis]